MKIKKSLLEGTLVKSERGKMSHVRVFLRIRQHEKGEDGEKFKLGRQSTQDTEGNSKKGVVSVSPPNGIETATVEDFDHVFEGNKKNEEVYQACFAELLMPFFNGHNVAVVVFGESNSGQSNTLFGGDARNILTSKKNSGLITLLANELFKRPSDGGGSPQDEKMTIKMTVLEIRRDKMTDLMAATNEEELGGNPCLYENELEGIILKNVIQLEIVGAKDCLTMLETALKHPAVWNQENSSPSEDSTMLIQFELTKLLFGKTLPLTSWFRIFKLPGAEKLLSIPTNGNASPDSNSRSISAFGNVIIQLAEINSKYQVPNYRESVLTTLLTDVLGGNCITNCLVTFKPIKTAASSMILRYAMRLKRIVNYPIQNTPNYKNLLRRYRFILKRIQTVTTEERGKDKVYIEELKKSMAAMELKVQKLKDKNVDYKTQQEAAEERLADANRKYAELTSSKTHMSSRMVSSEQEKLKLSKEIVDLQLENNTIRQEAEKQIFELKQQHLASEERGSSLERNYTLSKRAHEDQKERTSRLKQEYKDLTEEYINLKGNYATISEAHQNLVSTNHKLLDEIAKLADSKDQIIKHKDHREMQQLQEFTNQLKSIARSVSRQSKNGKTSTSLDLRTLSSKKLELEKQLLYNVQEREDKLDSIREEHDSEFKKLEDKLMSMKEDLKESQDQAERYKMKMAEQNSEIIIANEQKKQMEDLCKKLEEQLNSTSQEYCKRLETYITDLKGFVWNQNGEMLDQSAKEKIEHLDRMTEGLKIAYNADKEMLNSKLKRMTSYQRETLQRHESLLTAYKLVLWKTGVGNAADENIERDFAITLPPDDEIHAEQIKERNDLKTRLYLSQQHVKELQEKVDKLKDKLKDETSSGDRHYRQDEDGSGLNLRALRKDMRDFTVNVQVDLEKDRAELLTRCTLAEQQVAEYEEYIDTYVRRYQHEIMHLRKLLSEAGRMHSSDGALGMDLRPQRMLPPLQSDRRYAPPNRNSRY